MSDFSGFFAGTVGGVASTYVGQPFDVVKTRSQLNSMGVIENTRAILRTERFLGLYKGVNPAMVGSVVENGTVFGMNTFFTSIYNNYYASEAGEKSTKVASFIGGLSGVFSAIAISPIETIKVRMIANAGRKSMTDVAKSIVKQEGFVSLFKGLPAQILRDVPFNIVFFGSFDLITKQLRSLQQVNELSLSSVMFSGGMAGAIGWTFTLPMDAIKSRAQGLRTSERNIISLTNKVVKNTFQENGVRGFFRGWTSVVVRSFPVNGILFGVYSLFEQKH